MVPDCLSYHQRLCDHLKTHEKAIWDWFASDKISHKAFDEQRLTLLKSAVRLDTDNHGTLIASAQEVAGALEITTPLALYQGSEDSRNAALIYTPGEVNLLFQGDTLERLAPTELKALLGHEMAHYLHQDRDGGAFFTVDRMLAWICGEPGAHQAHARSLWLSRLYQEIHADRVALQVCGDRDAVISMLIKVTTGLTRFSVEDYLSQAREALQLNHEGGAEGTTHPETYIRALALADWDSDPDRAEQNLPRLVEGARRVERLDLLAQVELTGLTRCMILDFLSPAHMAQWDDSEALQAHARAYFPEFTEGAAQSEAALAPLARQDEDIRDYLCSVLLDFVTADPDLEEAPLSEAIAFADRHGMGKQIDHRIKRDLGVPGKRLSVLRKQLAKAAGQEEGDTAGDASSGDGAAQDSAEAAAPAPTPAPAPLDPVEQVLREPERPAPLTDGKDTP